MIIWGGFNGTFNLADGGHYNPTTDTWVATVTAGAPVARSYQSMVWTGTEMLVWGGYSAGYLGIGGRYATLTGIWTSTSNSGAPSNRSGHTAVWTGSEMILFGGYNGGYLNDTYSYTVGKSMFIYQKP